ncbi:MAG: hypothetical protein HY770_05730 [Chitinivibrionia bacterium]|nr:hypothetical protein [Chitinivibrionia bacterium]
MLFKKDKDPVIKKIKDAAAVRVEDAGIYKKKYHKVVLHSIDQNRETIDSFSIKMSMRLRSPLPRVKQLLKHLPCTIKSGMSVTQANKLFAVMEELGGKATIEAYYLTPGEGGEAKRPGVKGVLVDNGTTVVCPLCEWENETGAEYCSLCLHLFKKKRRAASAVPGQGEAENPVPGAATAETPAASGNTVVISKRWLLLAASFAVLLLLILAIKQ